MIRRGDDFVGAANVHTPGFAMTTESPAAADALAEMVYSDAPRRVSLVDLEPGGETFRAFLHAAHVAGYSVLIRPWCCSPYLAVDGSWEVYESRLGKNLVRNLRRRSNQIALRGDVRFQFSDGSTDLDALLAEAFRVEASGWKGRHGTAIAADPRTRKFYTALARWATSEGTFRLAFLRLDGRAIAMDYRIIQGSVCHSLKAGYDEEFHRYSPGTLLLHAVLRRCFAAPGISRIEFYGNGEDYKFLWTRTTAERLRLEAFAPTLRGHSRRVAFVYGRPLATRLAAAGRRLFPINFHLAGARS